MYARIRYPDGRETNVSLKDLARCPNDRDVEETSVEGRERVQRDEGRELVQRDEGREVLRGGDELRNDDNRTVLNGEGGRDNGFEADVPEKRRVSLRMNKGVPPDRLEYR